jgi:hypothetical protein
MSVDKASKMTAKATQRSTEVLHIRLSKANGKAIMECIKAKMKSETRNQNNCFEFILMDYFDLKQ